jgi:hypothetical protein
MLSKMAYNVLELPVVRFETVVYRNATNKDTMFMDFCKAKIIVFRGATAFAKALLSARITGRCCYVIARCTLLYYAGQIVFKCWSIFFIVSEK